ncbi:MAG: hypothetical protein QXG71_00335 [Nanopusillaceae archaeon]
MSEFAFNKIATILLSLIVLITVIILMYIYYNSYSKSETRIYNATNESWKNVNFSNTCYLENVMKISNDVSNFIKTKYGCNQISYSVINEIKENLIKFEVECIKISNLGRLTYLCDVYYDCEKKIINIETCKVR